MKQVVRGLIKDKETSKFLLVKHPKSDFWVLPGGHLEENENIFECLKREIKEEFNLEIEIKGSKIGTNLENIVEFPIPMMIYSIDYISNKYGKQKKLEYIFQAGIIGGNFVLKEDEIADFKWFSKQEIINLENTYKQIKDLMENLVS